MIGVGFAAAAAGGGRFTPPRPNLQYLGSGTSNLGQFRINPFDSSYIYTVSGNGSLSGDILFVTVSNGTATLTARAPKGTTQSASITAERKAPVLVNVPFQQAFDPCGDCRTDVNPNSWTCGCIGWDTGGGQWGVCICRGPGFSYWENQPGYNWSGSDFNNGQGEWWRILT